MKDRRVRQPDHPAPLVRAPLARALVFGAIALSACTGTVVELPTLEGPTPRSGTDAVPDGPSGGSSNGPGVETGASPLVCRDLGSVGASVPLRRLTAVQIERTVSEVLGVREKLPVSDEKLGTYRSNVSTAIDLTGARGYWDFAARVAEKANLAQCGASCLRWLLDDLGPRLFRRPLTPEQRTRYESLFKAGAADGARWVIAAMVQSPSFVYLDEVERADGYLDDYSMAARLALVLWGSNPDPILLMRAQRRALSTPEAIREEAQRMLADARSEGGIHDFVDQWLELHRLDDPDARPDLVALGAEALDAMRREPVRLFTRLLADRGTSKELLTTTQTVHLAPLVATYGRDLISKTDTSFTLDPMRRAGVLSLPGVMAALSHACATSPTLRGYAVLAGFLCSPPPPPPAGVKVTLPEVGPNASARQRLEAHFSDNSCGSCHRTMDGLGFAFEGIDWLGRTRDQEGGRAIDDVSTFKLMGEEITVDGVAPLAKKLAGSAAVTECIARQWTRYATGVSEDQHGECLVQGLTRALPEADGLKQMMLTYLSSDWFRRARGGV